MLLWHAWIPNLLVGGVCGVCVFVGVCVCMYVWLGVVVVE